jgi:DNA topoisomerase-1
MTILIVVESPGKIDKINSILGSEYKVVASFGHIRDLDPSSLSIDVNNNYAPNYIIPPDKSKVVQNLRYNASQCDEVIIASDMDREGEMIAHSIMEVLKLKDPKRIVFNEITKKAIMDAIENPGLIDNNMVMAQQTRRLLDRLVGYKISPLLWKTMQGKLSAGRVQSVVNRIIIDLENEINNYQSNPYYKIITSLNFNETDMSQGTCICNLMKGKEIYKIQNKEIAINLLKSIDKNTKYIVKNIINNVVNKSPPPPHITSTLMQEASTRYNMSSKKTMDIAQKLYEAGHITYMRTDSTMLSNDAVGYCKKYIEGTFGTNYYKYRIHKTKSKDAQEAHEAIRPTKIDNVTIEDMGEDAKKLYSIIWKRTVASLMADTKINVMTINIDCIGENNISLLELTLPTDDSYILRCNSETILFDGYMILYHNEKNIDSDEDSIKGSICIDMNTPLIFNMMEASEEYSKPPLRYNEAGLIKYLKKNGIGRPSTYASIISKIVEREYVVIKNIDGIKKDVMQYIKTKSFGKIKEKTKTIQIGSEKMKIIPTEMGIMVNNFMMKNFEPIMDIEFTALMEKTLDKVASGKAKWYNVLDLYYKTFSPMVEKLENETSTITNLKSEDKNLGMHPTMNQPIYLTKAKFGMCVKIMENEKWRYASINDMNSKDVTLEKAIELLEYPKTLGNIGSMIVSLNKGKYGLYFKIGSQIIGIKDPNINIEMLTLEYAKELASNQSESNVFKIKNKIVHLKNGQYGYYLMIGSGTKKPTNIPIPKNVDINSITPKIICDIIDKYESKPKINKYKK